MMPTACLLVFVCSMNLAMTFALTLLRNTLTKIATVLHRKAYSTPLQVHVSCVRILAPIMS